MSRSDTSPCGTPSRASSDKRACQVRGHPRPPHHHHRQQLLVRVAVPRAVPGLHAQLHRVGDRVGAVLLPVPAVQGADAGQPHQPPGARTSAAPGGGLLRRRCHRDLHQPHLGGQDAHADPDARDTGQLPRAPAYVCSLCVGSSDVCSSPRTHTHTRTHTRTTQRHNQTGSWCCGERKAYRGSIGAGYCDPSTQLAASCQACSCA